MTDGAAYRAYKFSRFGLGMEQAVLAVASSRAIRLYAAWWDSLGIAEGDMRTTAGSRGVRERVALLKAQGLDAGSAFSTAMLEALEAKL